MSYTKNNLLPEEKLLYYTRPHYIIFFNCLPWVLFFLIATNAGYFVSYNFPLMRSNIFGVLLLLVGCGQLLSAIISYYSSEYAITSRRILVKTGFIRRRSLEIFLDRIEGVYVEQSVVGRILNFGTVIIVGIGGTKNPFNYIPDPLQFRSKLQEQLPKRS